VAASRRRFSSAAARARPSEWTARAERRLGVGGRAEFDLLRARVVRRLYLPRVWVNEEADEEAAVAQAVYARAHRFEVGGRVESALGRDLVRVFGDERDGVGPRVERDL